MKNKKIKQPTGMTDIESYPLYERGGEEVNGTSMGFHGVRTIDGRCIKWEDLFYSKEDALKASINI